MRVAWIVLTSVLLVGVVGVLAWLNAMPKQPATTSVDEPVTTQAGALTLRLGLIPERDIFAQRRRYRALADYLTEQLDRPVELVTVNTYSGVLKEFEAGRIDAAFVGSMVAVLAHDRYGTRVLCKPQTPGGVTTYRGVFIVREDSPITDIGDLAGRSVALVRTTTAGNLYPIDEFVQRGMLTGDNPPQLHWAGTHDEVVRAVAAGQVDAGAMTDLRLEALLAEDASLHLRRLATGPAVPNNGLIVRADMPSDVADQLASQLLTMHETPVGRGVLATFGAKRFEPCTMAEYGAIYDMVERLGADWSRVGIEGKPPVRPASIRQDGGH